MLNIDYQIHMSDLLVGLGGVWAFVKVFVSNRDVQRDLTRLVKQNCADIERIDVRLETHHEWLIRKGMDQRSGSDRRLQ